MDKNAFKYELSSIIVDATGDHAFLMEDKHFHLFIDLVVTVGHASLIFDNLKIYLGGEEKSLDGFFEWWNEYKPWKQGEETVKEPEVEEKKGYDPFEGVKRKVGIF